jgi:hypothetical protein
MSIVVETRPIKSGCRYNAVGNPIVYGLVRKDHIVNQVNNNAGNAQLQINGVDLTAYYQAANRVYFESTAGGYEDFGPYDITAVAFSGGNTLITIYNGGLTYLHPTGGFVNNLSKRTDYAMSIQIEDSSGDVVGPLIEYQPENNGRLKLDVAHIIKTLLTPDFSQPAADAEDTGATFKFRISFSEFYDDAYRGYTDDTEWIIGVFASLQLFNNILTLDRNPDGGNMLAYNSNSLVGKWLTRFNRVPMWRGYPFTVSFLWPEGVATLKKRVVQKSITGATLSTTILAITARTDKMNRIALEVAINASAVKVELTLLDAADAAVSSTLTIDIKEPCSNPVHLFWKNSLGGDSFWQFEYNQEYEYGFRDKNKLSRLTLFAHNLVINEWEALNELLDGKDSYPVNITDLNMDSSVVKTQFRDGQQIYLLNATASVKAGVVSIAAGTKTMTRKYRHMFELEIELPETFSI